MASDVSVVGANRQVSRRGGICKPVDGRNCGLRSAVLRWFSASQSITRFWRMNEGAAWFGYRFGKISLREKHVNFATVIATR
jgi:hypothetical protein